MKRSAVLCLLPLLFGPSAVSAGEDVLAKAVLTKTEAGWGPFRLGMTPPQAEKASKEKVAFKEMLDDSLTCYILVGKTTIDSREVVITFGPEAKLEAIQVRLTDAERKGKEREKRDRLARFSPPLEKRDKNFLPSSTPNMGYFWRSPEGVLGMVEYDNNYGQFQVGDVPLCPPPMDFQ